MIYVQSYVDLITNSSTSVFTWANNIEGVKEIINAVLKSAGSSLTCDDLFDISTKYDIKVDETNDYYIDLADEWITDHPGEDTQLVELMCNYYEALKTNKWEESRLIQDEIYCKMVSDHGAKDLDQYARDYNDDSDEWLFNSQYIFTSKDPKNEIHAATLGLINNLFDSDASYC